MEFESVNSRKPLLTQLVVFLAWVAVTIVGAILTPNIQGHGTHRQLGLPACSSVTLFGRPCPGCGLTTSWTATIQGDIPTGFSSHLLGPIAYAFFTILAFVCLWAYSKKFLINFSKPFTRYVLWGTLIIFLGYGFVRFVATPNYGPPEERISFRR